MRVVLTMTDIVILVISKTHSWLNFFFHFCENLPILSTEDPDPWTDFKMVIILVTKLLLLIWQTKSCTKRSFQNVYIEDPRRTKNNDLLHQDSLTKSTGFKQSNILSVCFPFIHKMVIHFLIGRFLSEVS